MRQVCRAVRPASTGPDVKPPKRQCSKMVSDADGWHSRQCIRAAKVERKGRDYCAQHDPESVRAKALARTARYAERRQIQAEQDIQNAINLLTAKGYVVRRADASGEPPQSTEGT